MRRIGSSCVRHCRSRAMSSLASWVTGTQQTLSDLESSCSQSTTLQTTTRREDDQHVMTLLQKASSDIDVILSSAPTLETRLVSSIVVSGLDLKAVLENGSLSGLDVVGKDMSRVDLTGCNLVECTFTECDCSRSVWYRTSLFGSCFVRCRFDGTVFKKISVAPSLAADAPVFEDCSFRFCMLDVSSISIDNEQGYTGSKKRSPLFLRCDFDLATVVTSGPKNDFHRFDWMFHDCKNLVWSRP